MITQLLFTFKTLQKIRIESGEIQLATNCPQAPRISRPLLRLMKTV